MQMYMLMKAPLMTSHTAVVPFLRPKVQMRSPHRLASRRLICSTSNQAGKVFLTLKNGMGRACRSHSLSLPEK